MVITDINLKFEMKFHYQIVNVNDKFQVIETVTYDGDFGENIKITKSPLLDTVDNIVSYFKFIPVKVAPEMIKNMIESCLI